MTLSDCGTQNFLAVDGATLKILTADLKATFLLRPPDAVGVFSVNAAAAVNLFVLRLSLIDM